mmetsp:Transcript_31289/g.36510  ORF Transcript_31289/g.36510 Transcript_31289/m.36510 type:complete len:707 (+) Transcript_31289:27-2147(+)
MPHQVIENNNTPQLQPLQADENEDYDENDVGVLFSCRCESARPVTTLLSCLRNVSLSNHTTNAASTGLSSSTASQEGGGTLLTSSSRMTQAAAAAVVSGGGHGGKAGKVQYATVFVTEKSLTFQVYGVGKQSRATVDLQAGLFSEYYVAEQIVPLDSDDEDDGQNDHDTQGKRETEVIRGGEFAINLTTVLECLCVLGPNNLDRTTLCLSYDSRDAIFKIELLEQTIPGAGSVVGGSGPGPISAGCIISNCAIPALAVEDDDCHDDHDLANDHQFGSYGFGHQSLDVAFRSHPIVARARIKSDFLKDAIMELTDVGGSVCASIGLSKKYGLELATFGHSTECHVVVPYLGNHPEIFVSLEGVDGNFDGRGHRGGGNDNVCYAYSYPLHSVLSAMRGLEIASETCISINANGMIAIQHQVLDTVGNGDPNYIDFVMGCLDEGHDSNDGVDEAETTATTNDQGYESVYDNTQQSNNNNTPFSESQEEEEQSSQQQKQQQQFSPKNNDDVHLMNKNQRNQNHSDDSTTDDEGMEETQRIASESQSQQEQSASEVARHKSLFGTVANISAISSSSSRTYGGRRRRITNARRQRNRRDESLDGQEDGDDHTESIVRTAKKRQIDKKSNVLDNDYDDDKNRDSQEINANESEFEDDDEENTPLDVTATFASTSFRRRSSSDRNEQNFTTSSSSPQLMYGDTHLEASGDEEEE